jgi:hypothetical protein
MQAHQVRDGRAVAQKALDDHKEQLVKHASIRASPSAVTARLHLVESKGDKSVSKPLYAVRMSLDQPSKQAEQSKDACAVAVTVLTASHCSSGHQQHLSCLIATDIRICQA